LERGTPRAAPSGASRKSLAAGAADSELRRLDQLAALGRLVAEVAHEVRNPLVPVKTFLDLLASRGGDPELRAGFLELAREELDRALRLLDLLLEQAGAGAAEERSSACDAATALDAVRRLLAARADAAGVRLEAEAASRLPAVAIERDALRQVLLNLALNALDATPIGGDVRLSARALGRAVEIAVEDRGPGIPAALRRRAFEPFFSTRAGRPGGLGLAIARRLVEAAGGTLVAGHRPGGGARLRLQLPVAPGKQADSESRPAHRRKAPQAPRSEAKPSEVSS
jgi:signal transduction histidine kinase